MRAGALLVACRVQTATVPVGRGGRGDGRGRRPQFIVLGRRITVGCFSWASYFSASDIGYACTLESNTKHQQRPALANETKPHDGMVTQIGTFFYRSR